MNVFSESDSQHILVSCPFAGVWLGDIMTSYRKSDKPSTDLYGNAVTSRHRERNHSPTLKQQQKADKNYQHKTSPSRRPNPKNHDVLPNVHGRGGLSTQKYCTTETRTVENKINFDVVRFAEGLRATCMKQDEELQVLRSHLQYRSSQDQTLESTKRNLQISAFKKQSKGIHLTSSDHSASRCSLIRTADKSNSTDDSNEQAKILQDKLKEKELEIVDLRNKIDVLESRIRRSDQKITYLEKKNAEMERRSDEITQKMAMKIDNGGRFENTNDEFANSSIAQKVQSLYDDDWVNLYRKLRRELPNIPELEGIKQLSVLTKCCYIECVKLAEREIPQFLLLDKTESLSVQDEIQKMITHRRRICQNVLVRTKVKKTIKEILFSADEVQQWYNNDIWSKVREQLESFIEKVIDCCWLVAVAHPPIILNFDVVGMQWHECEEKWTEFSTKQKVEDMNKIEGTIVEVVWPSVELKDGTGFYRKGDAIVVKKGIKRKNIH